MTNEQLLEGYRLSQEINRLKENISSINTRYGVILKGQKQKSLGVYESHEIQVDDVIKDAIQRVWEEELKKLEKQFSEL